MSVQDGEIDFNTVYMVDYTEHKKPKSPRQKPTDDDCLIVGFSRDHLKPRCVKQLKPDVLCPIDREYYKNQIDRLDSRPKLKKVHFDPPEIDPVPIENEIQDNKRTEYLVSYCARDMPFMSVNLARRARALQTLHLPDDVYIPDTTYAYCYRPPPQEKFVSPLTMSLRPQYEPELTEELRRITRVTTGDSTYEGEIGLIGKLILEKSPYGPQREEPNFGRWKNPYTYTYRL